MNTETILMSIVRAKTVSAHTKEYTFSYCRYLKNKPKTFPKQGNEFFPLTANPDAIKELVKNGFAINSGHFKDNKRNLANSYNISLFIADIDNKGDKGGYEPKLTLDDALKNPIIRRFGAIYTSPSHSEDWHRFRVILFLPCVINSSDFKALFNLLNPLCNYAFDKACSDSSRLFYGNEKALFLNWENIYVLPVETIEIARKTMVTERGGESRNTTNYSQELTTEQIDKLIDDIIFILPPKPKGCYDDYRTLLTAIKNIKGEQFAIDIALQKLCTFSDDNWTQIIQSSTGDFNIGTIINIAKEYGNFDYVDWLKKNGNSQGKRDHRQKTVQNLEKTYEKSSDEVNELDVSQLIEQLVNKLAKPDVSEADRKKEIAKFTTVYRVSPSIIEKSIDEKLKGDNRVQDITELLPNVDDLLNVPNERLDLSLIFDSFLEACVQETAKQVPTNPDAIISCWLPVLASVIGIRSKVVVNPATDYKLPFILRMGIVAKSGNKKSPTLKQAVKALDELDSSAYHRYQEALKDYEEDLAYYEKNKQGEKPTEPKLKQFIVQDFTIDGLLSILEDNPSLLGYIDELYGYFKRMNKFNNGDDVQRDLELFEGKKIKKTRASKDNNKYIEKHAVSLVGTIQEVALRKVLADDDDLTGVSARFLFWAGKMPLGKINFTLDAIDLNFLTISQQVIESLANLNIHSDLLLDNDAKKLFQEWQNGIMESIGSLSLPQLENKYAKIEADCVKFAGILHYYHLVTGSDLITNEIVINGEIMRRAIVLANYYLRHFCYIVTKCQDELLNAQLMKILELVKRKGEINATDIKNYLKTDFGKTSANDINEILLNLIELGKVDRIPTKQGVKVKFKP
jgi:hypothetical protein